jgi:hypothetical protein
MAAESGYERTAGIRQPLERMPGRRMEKSNNPFAIAVMAHLKLLETKGDLLARKHFKYVLIRHLLQMRFSRKRINALFKFLDWMIKLPEELEEKLIWELSQEEEKMAPIGGMERILMEKYREKYLEEGLTVIREFIKETFNSVLEHFLKNCPNHWIRFRMPIA